MPKDCKAGCFAKENMLCMDCNILMRNMQEENIGVDKNLEWKFLPSNATTE